MLKIGITNGSGAGRDASSSAVDVGKPEGEDPWAQTRDARYHLPVFGDRPSLQGALDELRGNLAGIEAVTFSDWVEDLGADIDDVRELMGRVDSAYRTFQTAAAGVMNTHLKRCSAWAERDSQEYTDSTFQLELPCEFDADLSDGRYELRFVKHIGGYLEEAESYRACLDDYIIDEDAEDVPEAAYGGPGVTP
ncbi:MULTISPECIES: hypothetical protein [unclassified Xanthobacter]|uniref:hypothetical protein n=1 Tax=unclassified Xanthobacter TaxID=2623496 RepID=UPI001F47B958|nr:MULTISPECIES: hypothetical protein [unclassified Xanthobacter]